MPSADGLSFMANSTRGSSDGQSLWRALTRERETSAMTPLTRSTFAFVLWCHGDPRAEGRLQGRPELAGEPCVEIRDDAVGDTDILEP